MEQNLLLLFGVLLVIVIIGCYISMRNNSKKCSKRCSKRFKKKRCRESYITEESYGTDAEINVLQTTATGDLSVVDINPIIKGFIDGKSNDTSASFRIKELTTTGNINGSNVYGKQLCIGATCLTESDLKNLKMITTSALTGEDVKLLKALGTGVNMKMNASGSTGSQLVGWFWGGTGNSYVYPTMDGADGYSTQAKQKNDKIFSFVA